jgi:ketosteroid isomerase-like protein
MMRARLLAAVAVFSVLAVGVRADERQDRADVQKVFERYLQSVKGADLAIASDIWSHTADVIVVTPFGRFAGWDSVQQRLYVDFLQKMFAERNLEPANVAMGVAGDAAWLTFDWTFTGKMANGQPISSKGWESHVYRRTREGWRIVQLHYSVPPPAPAP